MRFMRLLLLPLLLANAPAGERYWQCAAFARQFSGIEIRGDAWTWWGQAEGRFERGRQPRVGAVMAFVPGMHTMRLGHVATVSHIVGDREIAVTHANWSPINGTRGQIERDVRVRDVSAAGDWSTVRVWYAPIGDLGTTAWGVDGFIYPTRVRELDRALQRARARPAAQAPRLAYARLDTLTGGAARLPVFRLGNDVVRLASLEASTANR